MYSLAVDIKLGSIDTIFFFIYLKLFDSYIIKYLI